MLRRHGIALALYAILAALALREIWPADRVLGHRDLLVYFLPMRLYARECVRQGVFPERNPYVSSGNPFFANPETQILYPPAWGYLAFGLRGGGIVYYSMHLLLGAMGANLLARRLGVSPTAALAAGIVFGFSGFASSILEVQNVLCDRFVPLILWAALSLRERQSPSRVAFVAALWALMFFGGEPSLWAATLLLSLGLLLWPPGTRVRLPAAGGALALGLLMAMGQLVPTALYVMETDRFAGLGLADVSQWSLSPWELLEMIVPGALTTTFPGKSLGAQTYIATVYTGMTALGLIVARLPSRRFLPCERWTAAMGLVFLALAMGPATPLFAAYRILTAGMVRYPVRFMSFVTLAAALLSSFALDRLVENRRHRALLAPILLAILSLDLIVVTPREHLRTVPASAVERPPCDAPWIADLEDGRFRALPLAKHQALLAATLQAEGPEQPGIVTRNPFGLSGMLCRIRSAAVEPVLPLLAYDRWLTSSPPPVLGRASVRVVLLPESEGSFRLKPNRLAARPRFSLASRAYPDPGGKEGRDLMARLPLDQVLLDITWPEEMLGRGEVTVLRDEAHRIELDVEAKSVAALVVGERFERGWIARVDGYRVRVERCDQMFMAVHVPAGRHRVTLTYRAPWLRESLGVSALAWIAAGLFPWLKRRQTTPRPTGATGPSGT